MFEDNLSEEFAFLDAGRHLQSESAFNATSSEDDFDAVSEGIFFVGLYILTMVFGCCCMCRTFMYTSRVNSVDAHDLPHLLKSTLAKREQAVLDLFERAKVTMKVTKDDIHGDDHSCIEDIESGFDAGGILKLSRPVAAGSNSTAAASSWLPPPEWCYVPNLCAICLDSYEQGQVVAWSSDCRHAFHQDCITHYLAKKMIGGDSPCPCCRQKFCDLLPKEPLDEDNTPPDSSESREAGQEQSV